MISVEDPDPGSTSGRERTNSGSGIMGKNQCGSGALKRCLEGAKELLECPDAGVGGGGGGGEGEQEVQEGVEQVPGQLTVRPAGEGGAGVRPQILQAVHQGLPEYARTKRKHNMNICGQGRYRINNMTVLTNHKSLLTRISNSIQSTGRNM